MTLSPDAINLIVHLSILVFMAGLGYYLLLNLQWYSYSITRVITKHHKWRWHVYFFVIPILVFIIIFAIKGSDARYLYAFLAYLYLIYVPSLLALVNKLDKRLKFTRRIRRFALIYAGFILLFEVLVPPSMIASAPMFYCLMALMSLLFAFVFSYIYEKILLNRYTNLAKVKLAALSNTAIILITASFGKTSIKNYLAHILQHQFLVYATPRSVNTYIGLIADVNNNLNNSFDYYIAEAGARAKGDIEQIGNLLHPDYVILGEIGIQHIEYFKTKEAIVETKSEILKPQSIKRAYVYRDDPLSEKTKKLAGDIIYYYPPLIGESKSRHGGVGQHGVVGSQYKEADKGKGSGLNAGKDGQSALRNVTATLEGISFELYIDGHYEPFHSSVLGKFNVNNMVAAIMLANSLGVNVENLKKAISTMQPTPHRLQKIQTEDKLILDDSFNGNEEGMLEGIRLSSLYKGRKIIVTPGLVENKKEANIRIAKAINEVYDIAIITGELNSALLNEHISVSQKIRLKDKAGLEQVLISVSLPHDLIYFANDAPAFI